MRQLFLLSIISLLCLQACKDSADPITATTNNSPIVYKSELSQTAKDFWYDGTAEVTSYKLSQARYGELRAGQAVLVFVSEPFSISSNTKADQASPDNISVLKLNATKKFNTGIYPYSMMTSTFYPIDLGNHSVKISSSSQEWCGQTYMELKNEDQFKIKIDSYFEGETAQLTIEKSWLEDDIWSIIKLRPDQLPIGEITMIPSFFYLRLKHKETRAYNAVAQVETLADTIIYSLEYPELNRRLSISFTKSFPYQILGWEERYPDGYGENAQVLTTTAQKIKSIKTPYWQQNSNKYGVLRDSLGLK